MRTAIPFKRLLLPALFIALLASCGNKHPFPKGYWHGLIMERYVMVLELEPEGGRIYSYDGDYLFQDDTLTQMQRAKDSLSFYIPDKDTWFRGLADENVISGVFIFNDGTTMEATFAPKGREELADRGLLPHVLPSRTIMYRKYAPEAIRSDLQEYAKLLRENHPGMKALDADSFDMKLAGISQEITDSMDILTLTPYFMRLGALLECSHTRARPGTAVRRTIEHYRPILPAELMIDGGRLWLTGRVAVKDDLPGKCEVLAINGQDSKALLHALKEIIPVTASAEGPMEYEFNRYQSAYLPFLVRDTTFDIRCLDASGDTVDHHFDGIPVRDLDWANDPWDMDWKLSTMPAQKTAIFTIPSFNYPDPMGLQYYLDSVFTVLAEEGIQNLVIDIRGNEGGPPFPSRILLSYLIDKPFAYFASTGGERRDPSLAELEGLYETLPPSPKVFTGKNLVVISDAGCMSTAGHFLSLIAYHKAGRIAGQAPESHFSCYDNSFDASLPNTGMECSIPTTRFMTNVRGFSVDKPLEVDIPVEGDKGIRQGDEDPVLDKVLDLLISN